MDFVDVAVERDLEIGAGEGEGEFFAEAVDDGLFEGGLVGWGDRIEGGDAGLEDVAGAVEDPKRGAPAAPTSNRPWFSGWAGAPAAGGAGWRG